MPSGVQGVRTTPEMTCGFLIQLVFCKAKRKKTMWCSGAPPPKKNPGSASGPGKILVIRLMIPQRVVHQYTQYCLETGFKAFSETTMLRVLSECSASVRKSLRGLDYFAAEGARAFDNLAALVRKLSQLDPGKEWETPVGEGLKANKLYLKGDYKVMS